MSGPVSESLGAAFSRARADRRQAFLESGLASALLNVGEVVA